MKKINTHSNKRSAFIMVIMMIGLLGCSLQADRDYQLFQIDAKNNINPTRLQDWALSVAKTNKDGYEMQAQDIPFWIRKIEIGHDPTGFLGTRSMDEGRTLFVVWGGGFGHWGLIIGDTNLAIHDDNSSINYVNWVPGVYFFMQ